MKLIRSQAGFTIAELMAVIAISGFLMAAAATGFSAFFAKFNDLSKKMEIQRDAFNGLQMIKNGIQIGKGSNLKFQGIATADSIIFQGSNLTYSDAIILYPPKSDNLHQNDYIRVWFQKPYIRYTYLDGQFQPASPEYLFPARGKGDEIQVTKLAFSKANLDGNVTKVVKVDLEARVKLRPKSNKPKDYKYISYTTRMALTMK